MLSERGFSCYFHVWLLLSGKMHIALIVSMRHNYKFY
jgi:hypothetical protein